VYIRKECIPVKPVSISVSEAHVDADLLRGALLFSVGGVQLLGRVSTGTNSLGSRFYAEDTGEHDETSSLKAFFAGTWGVLAQGTGASGRSAQFGFTQRGHW
jgi:hypothetical protein